MLNFKPEDVIWTGTSAETKPPKAFPGQIAIEYDTATVWVWVGSQESTIKGGSWVVYSFNGINFTLSGDYVYQFNGRLFIAGIYNLGLASAATEILAFKTPTLATTPQLISAHFTATASADSTFELLEGPTITGSTGSQVSVFNQNRYIDGFIPSTIRDVDGVADKITQNPTITADGTIIIGEIVGAGANDKLVTLRDLPMLLSPDTMYAVRLTAKIADVETNLGINWGE